MSAMLVRRRPSSGTGSACARGTYWCAGAANVACGAGAAGARALSAANRAVSRARSVGADVAGCVARLVGGGEHAASRAADTAVHSRRVGAVRLFMRVPVQVGLYG